jgi:hypothetical protein
MLEREVDLEYGRHFDRLVCPIKSVLIGIGGTPSITTRKNSLYQLPKFVAKGLVVIANNYY